MVDDLQGEKNRKALLENVKDFQKKVERYKMTLLFAQANSDGCSLRKDTRAALLASKRAIDSRAKSNRDELLSSASVLSEKQTSSEKTT